MTKKEKNIYLAFKGKLVGSPQMKLSVCKTLAGLPPEIIDFVTKNCWFMGSIEDAWAFTFTGNDLKDQHLIFLSDGLLMQEEYQIRYSIVHEIGHVMLNHKNSILIVQSKEEIRQQEAEADEFANNYL
ncbi:MAG TPA: hypothetical protein VKC89_01865 [Patescibacteria group bacterium]|nr:hypothetical protein [Patescibacteria group bacterium]